MVELLLGDEAVGIAAIDAGISAAFSYPGTPATEIFEFIQRQEGDRPVVARWSTNEKVAYEEALGMSFTGKRSLVSMKHVGLNVAADPFMSSSLTGAHGAMVIAVADDPGMHSSQNEQDSRFYGDFAKVPIMEPSTQQEAYDMTRAAFMLSEELKLPVMIRLVTRLSHSRSTVIRTEPDEVPDTIRPVTETSDWTLMPVNARRRFRHLLDQQKALGKWSENAPFNSLALRGSKGIITTGIAYNYVREALGEDHNFSLLKVGTYPVPTGLIRKLVDHCEVITLVEEGYPYIETLLIGLLGVPGKTIEGKRSGALPMDGEMTVDLVRRALGMEEARLPPVVDLPCRPPALCRGCPHCDTFHAILEAVENEAEPILFSDIGCYTLGALPPYNAVQSCVDMGSSISMGLGATKAGAHPVLCTIGDSTFTHSGMTPLLEAAHLDADMTVILLDNATVAMTGGQEVFATGKQFIRLLKGLGVDEEHLISIEPLKKHQHKNAELLRREIKHPGLSVIVATRACIHTARRTRKKQETAPAVAHA